MIRIHLLQQWYDLSDPGVEEALYDVLAMQRFAGIDLGTAPVPDETTICKFVTYLRGTISVERCSPR